MSMIYEMNRVTLLESMNARPDAPVIPDHIKEPADPGGQGPVRNDLGVALGGGWPRASLYSGSIRRGWSRFTALLDRAKVVRGSDSSGPLFLRYCPPEFTRRGVDPPHRRSGRYGPMPAYAKQ